MKKAVKATMAVGTCTYMIRTYSPCPEVPAETSSAGDTTRPNRSRSATPPRAIAPSTRVPLEAVEVFMEPHQRSPHLPPLASRGGVSWRTPPAAVSAVVEEDPERRRAHAQVGGGEADHEQEPPPPLRRGPFEG